MYKLNDSKMFADVTNNIAIIINSGTGFYYGINNCGSIIFQAIIDGYSKQAISDALKKFENFPKDIDQKLDIFINELLQKEIIIEDTDSKSLQPLNIDENVIKQDKFEMILSQYTDAQDLLIADPIHDVDEEVGWQPVFKEDKKDEK